MGNVLFIGLMHKHTYTHKLFTLNVSVYTHMYIYEYVYVCVCVCIHFFKIWEDIFQTKNTEKIVAILEGISALGEWS